MNKTNSALLKQALTWPLQLLTQFWCLPLYVKLHETEEPVAEITMLNHIKACHEILRCLIKPLWLP